MGSRVPDYRGRFLRGIQSDHSVGETVANTLKSHNHTQPTHTHSFSGQLVSTALSGTAAGQRYTDNHTGLDGSGYYGRPGASESFGIRYVEDVSGEGISVTKDYRRQTAWTDTTTKTASSSSVSGNLRNGAVTGTIGQGGGDPTDYTGDSETAPDHIYIRCLIRAKP